MIEAGEMERRHLMQADKHIADTERHITEQETGVSKMRLEGHDVKTFETMLVTFRATLATQQKHRELILGRLKELGD